MADKETCDRCGAKRPADALERMWPDRGDPKYDGRLGYYLICWGGRCGAEDAALVRCART